MSNTTEKWVEDFRKIGDGSVRFIETREEVIDFIRALLSKRDTALVEGLEKQKKDKTPKDKESTRCACGGYPAICGCDDYNQGISDAQALIRNEEKSA